MRRPEEDDFSCLITCQIGQGLDAKVYRTRKKFLFKVYHNYLLEKSKIMTNVPLDEEGVRIFRRDDFRKDKQNFSFNNVDDTDIKFIIKE